MSLAPQSVTPERQGGVVLGNRDILPLESLMRRPDERARLFQDRAINSTALKQALLSAAVLAAALPVAPTAKTRGSGPISTQTVPRAHDKGGNVFRLITAVVATYVIALSVALPSAQPQPEGMSTFRFDTFGSEQLWTEVLGMQHVIEEKVSPAVALSVGLKVDVDALPAAVIGALENGQVDLNDPAVTVQLLKLNAVVGVIGKVVGANDNLATVGITCALCHSTVDDSFAPGIGRRLDGWANITLNPGAIIALSPAITNKNAFQSWGPGKYTIRASAFLTAPTLSKSTARQFPLSSRQPLACKAWALRPSPVTVQSRTGITMSPSRRWADRAASAILVSA